MSNERLHVPLNLTQCCPFLPIQGYHFLFLAQHRTESFFIIFCGFFSKSLYPIAGFTMVGFVIMNFFLKFLLHELKYGCARTFIY